MYTGQNTSDIKPPCCNNLTRDKMLRNVENVLVFLKIETYSFTF